jgi:hypothetical protein
VLNLEKNEANYAAQIVKISSVLPIKDADRIVKIPMFGMQGVTSKDSFKTNDLAILFPTECQLSEDYCKYNNLHSSQLLNKNTEVKGYLSDNRRIRAIRLRSENSNCLIMPISSLSYLDMDISGLKEGDVFNSIGGVEICRKYKIVQQQSSNPKNKTRNQQRKCRIEPKLLPEHIDTDNWWRNEHKISDEAEVIVTAKYHGTSVRLANQVCDRELTRLEKVLKWLGFRIEEKEYDYFAASRRVVKDYKRRIGMT